MVNQAIILSPVSLREAIVKNTFTINVISAMKLISTFPLSFSLHPLSIKDLYKLPSYSADDFFEVISKRYEKGSLIITTNKSFEQLVDIFSDTILPSAIIDRVVHHGIIIKINGPSYRTKDLKKRGDDGK